MNNASVPQLMDVYLSGTPNDVTTCKRFLWCRCIFIF
jgi:hypothetical protein